MDVQGKSMGVVRILALFANSAAPRSKSSRSGRKRRHRARQQTGGALIYALLAILVISILTISVGRLISYHFQAEENARGFARAMYIAEAAANWQLNRMSRSSRPGVYIAGRLDHTAIANIDSSAARGVFSPLALDDTNAPAIGNARVWTSTVSSTSKNLWTPPHDFLITAIGEDPATSLRRGVQFHGVATSLAERYSLFGASSLTFQAGSGKNDVTIVGRGYAGTNGLLAYTPANRPPVGKTLNAKGQFGGCRLGGARARVQPVPNRWQAGWDFPRLPDTVFWPLIDDYVAGVWKGKSVSDLATENDNAQIYYKDTDGVFKPLREKGHVVTKLTPDEFKRSKYLKDGQVPQPTLLLRARYGSQTKTANLFYFTHLYMRPGDILILDLRADRSSPTAIHIVINNPDMQIVDLEMKSKEIVVTNLAYYEGGSKAKAPAYLWMNNTNAPFVYRPFTNINGGNPIDSSPISGAPDKQSFKYTFGDLGPELRGLVYGNNGYASEGNHAGDITIDSAQGATVGVLVGNHVTLKGRVTANGTGTGKVTRVDAQAPSDVEDTNDARRYVMFYRVDKYYEVSPTGATTYARPTAYSYGAFKP